MFFAQIDYENARPRLELGAFCVQKKAARACGGEAPYDAREIFPGTRQR